MATIKMQRDLVITLRRETLLNIRILSKLIPVSLDLSKQIFKENALEKPTQSVFNHLSYYLFSIIDPKASAALPWPLYDTKSERTYRNELSVLVSSYSSKGMLSPVMSSYFVNPGCYKVTFLVFQLSQLALQRVLMSKMDKDHQKYMYNELTEKFKYQKTEEFIERVEKETEMIHNKFSSYIRKRETMGKMAEMLRQRITVMEKKLESSKAQDYIDNIVDKFVKHKTLDEDIKTEILKIKDVHESPDFFKLCLKEMDEKFSTMEIKWGTKTSQLFTAGRETLVNTKALIERYTGEAEQTSYTVEYNPKTDEIRTQDLENQVNSQQKYVLKNIIRDDILNFPNLIRGFLISICFILKDTEIGDEIYRFNEYLDVGRRNYREIVLALRILLERVNNAESFMQPIQPVPVICIHSESIRENKSELHPIPDLSDLKINQNFHSQMRFDAFTPLNYSKHQFNMHRKMTASFMKPLPKSVFITPFHHPPRDDFLRSVMSCRFSSYDQLSSTQNMNVSIISQATNRGNETIAQCSSGFTKQQINRLLSTKKSSSSKKFKYKTDRPRINVKKGGLFNESNVSNESMGLIRCHSSPNLFENRDSKRSVCKARSRKLSIMKEDSLSLLEVSGIVALRRDSSQCTPTNATNLERCRLHIDSVSLPSMSITPEINDIEFDLNKEINVQIESPTVYGTRKSTEFTNKDQLKIETPKTNSTLVTKTNSLEKIINRFKKVRASTVPLRMDDEKNDFKAIAEEKENFKVNVEVFANRLTLPDLVSPSCSIVTQKSSDFFDQLLDSDEERPRRPRESLGTALGVDHTFLDQFELID